MYVRNMGKLKNGRILSKYTYVCIYASTILFTHLWMQIAALAERQNHVNAEKWHPAEGEDENDDRDCLCGTFLLRYADLLPVF